MSLIELRNIDVSIAGQAVLRAVSFQLEQGERLVLMGASGVGKTTLLRVMAGLQQPSSGEILLHGKLLSAVGANQRRIAWLSQDYALYPQLSVEQNIAVALRQQGLTATEISNRFQQVADWFDVAELRDRLPSQISGGQAQRVAFAKAVARQPQLLLLDEPFSQVDYSLRNHQIDKLLTVCEQLKTAVCWVTHDPQEAFRVATRIAVLADGHLVQDDCAEQIYGRPTSRLVADLTSVWPVNWLPLDRPELAALLPYVQGTLVGVRPEHFSLTITTGLKFELLVESVRFLGFASLVQGRIGETSVQVLDVASQCQVGSRVTVSLNPSNILC